MGEGVSGRGWAKLGHGLLGRLAGCAHEQAWRGCWVGLAHDRQGVLGQVGHAGEDASRPAGWRAGPSTVLVLGQKEGGLGWAS